MSNSPKKKMSSTRGYTLAGHLPAVRSRLGKLQAIPTRCLRWGGGLLHKECPEEGKEDSAPSCCNCNLAEGEKPHPSTYRGCREEQSEGPQDKYWKGFRLQILRHAGRVLRGGSTKLKRPRRLRQYAAAAPAAVNRKRAQTPDQSVPDPNVDRMASRGHTPLKILSFNVNSSAMSSADNSKTWSCFQRHVWNLMRNFFLQITTFT
jgi:hypothetical protein